MSEQTFHGAQAPISAADLDALQQVLGYRLPEAFHAHYLRWNGGAPALDWIECAALFEPVRINSFEFILPAGCSSGSSEDMLGCYRLMRERDLIPAHLLPFAYDDGGNFFCLDMASGAVGFYPMDSFCDDLPMAEYHRQLWQPMFADFAGFMGGLRDEDSLELW